ncbi:MULTISPECIES: branched-chain amino acid ABC transporter permease [unclassified Chelatococcus]|uniref:branched-chain amino acid ABC transporter permease n=1 Tax=unclassified Chelatococcus TaxID=2638111 RepID=UPI001BCA7D8D|nr:MULTISPECIES: branched-chain amino acid ABC transporter permease [unclassified Chelatococcus]MBS7701229.1 branched-chain amino acid ABC transporter permease [Chelatococcus sp. YT9]MBX3557360.1 branched-chain amino acid ABC transporter permease [Chelatococcus sp.]
MDEIFFIAIRGFGLGAAFAAIALSLNVIYRATHILNFAQGGMFVLGGLLGVQFSEGGYGTVHWIIGLLVSGAAMGVLMAIQGAVTLWPLRHSAEQQSWLITTLSVSIIISALLLLTLGPWSSEFAGRVPSFGLFGMLTPMPYLVLPILAAICFIGLAIFYRQSLTGLALSAMSQDLEAAAAAGLRVRRLQVLSFAIGGIVVGTAGYAAAPIISIAPEAGIRYVISGFVVAVVGGIGNMTGALISGPVIGVIAVLATYQLGGQFQGLVTTIILTLILLLRPGGLFGAHSARRV